MGGIVFVELLDGRLTVDEEIIGLNGLAELIGQLFSIDQFTPARRLIDLLDLPHRGGLSTLETNGTIPATS